MQRWCRRIQEGRRTVDSVEEGKEREGKVHSDTHTHTHTRTQQPMSHTHSHLRFHTDIFT